MFLVVLCCLLMSLVLCLLLVVWLRVVVRRWRCFCMKNKSEYGLMDDILPAYAIHVLLLVMLVVLVLALPVFAGDVVVRGGGVNVSGNFSVASSLFFVNAISG